MKVWEKKFRKWYEKEYGVKYMRALYRWDDGVVLWDSLNDTMIEVIYEGSGKYTVRYRWKDILSDDPTATINRKIAREIAKTNEIWDEEEEIIL